LVLRNFRCLTDGLHQEAQLLSSLQAQLFSATVATLLRRYSHDPLDARPDMHKRSKRNKRSKAAHRGGFDLVDAPFGLG
jgi:hypothetical protein